MEKIKFSMITGVIAYLVLFLTLMFFCQIINRYTFTLSIAAAIIFTFLDSFNVSDRHAGIIGNTFKHEGEISLPVGMYWKCFALYYVIAEIEISENEISASGTNKSSDNAQTTMSGSLWLTVKDPLRHYRFGDDAKKASKDDFSDTIRSLIFRSSKSSLEGMGNKPFTLDKNDSIIVTLANAGYSDNNLSIKIGDVSFSKATDDAEEAILIAKKMASSKKINQRAINLEKDQIVLQLLIGKQLEESYSSIEAKAKKKLGTIYSDFELNDQMLILIKGILKITAKEMDVVQKNAVDQYNLEKGNVQAYTGLSGAKPFINTK